MTFLYLLVGHLTGDFVLQTDKMAENKGRQWKWNLLHVLVVTLCILVFSFPFGLLLNILVLLSGIIHYILDFYKNEIKKILHLSELAGFLVDQLIHILLLFIISLAAHPEGRHMIDIEAVKCLIVLVLVTSFSAVFTQFVLGALFPRAEGRFFEEGEKSVGILTRLYISAVFYITFVYSAYYIVLLLIAGASFFTQYKLGWNRWMSRSHLGVKLLLDTLIPAVCIVPLVL